MHKPHKRTAVVIAAAVLCFVQSCNPAKQLQRQNEAISNIKAAWVNEWVQAHPCPKLPPVNLDSLCGGNDFAFSAIAPDTVRDTTRTRDTVRITFRIHDTLTKHILVPYEDTRTVDLLKDSMRAMGLRLATYQGAASNQDAAGQLAAADKSRKTWLWAFIAACVVIAGGLGWKIYSFVRNPLTLIK